MISAQDILAAHALIKPYIHQTPVLQSSSLNDLAGCEVFFKCENFQKIGAFKARGGFNAVLSLTREQQLRGITTHSSGNHAQAIALAAKMVGVPAYIVMPSNAPIIKKQGVTALGGEIILCEPTLQAREDTVQQVIAKTGATFVHPFDNDAVIAGQATAAVELLNEIKHLNAILTPVGGGGLLSGTALAAHYFAENTKVIAGEPEGAADAVLSFKSGKVEKAPFINTIADGLLTNLSERTLAIILAHVAAIELVSEQEIIDAMQLIYERLKIVIEPSCAVPFAVLLKHKAQFQGQRVGIILTGGNVDLSKLPF